MRGAVAFGTEMIEPDRPGRRGTPREIGAGRASRCDDGIVAIMRDADAVELALDVAGDTRRVGEQDHRPAILPERAQSLDGVQAWPPAIMDDAPDVADQRIIGAGNLTEAGDHGDGVHSPPIAPPGGRRQRLPLREPSLTGEPARHL